MPLERTVPLRQSEARIDQVLACAGLTPALSCHGRRLSSTVATLEGSPQRDGDRVGCGKGYEDEARVGAKFEAYEHFFGPQALRSATRLCGREATLDQISLADVLPLRMLATDAAPDIGVIRFDAVSGHQPALDYPAFLIDYTYASRPLAGDYCDYRRAKRYSCGTGLAVGVDAAEAFVHAVGEVIERHAVGTYIARNHFHGLHGHARRIARASFPEALRVLVSDAEEEVGDRIELSHAASDIDCPVMIARCLNRTIAGLHVIGSGASLYGAHAAARAVKELVQQYKVVEGEPAALDHWEACKRRLARWPRLQQSLRMPPTTMDEPFIDFRAVAGEVSRLPLPRHLDMLIARCAAAGRPVWTRVLREESAGVVLACAVMPRMERYAIVGLGGVVVPCYA